MQEFIDQLFAELKDRNFQEIKLIGKETLSELYRTIILQGKFETVEEYMKAWRVVQNKFMEEVNISQGYQLWVDFSTDKV